jgi:tRNA (guanine37-N1)-methyltransferase
MRFDILSLFPDYFRGPFDESILRRASEKGALEIAQVDIRDFAEGKHRQVDDRPYGGGPGMVMMAEPVVKAIQSVKKPQSRVVYLSPQGAPLNAKKCKDLASYDHLVLLCGHYEGIDQRVLDNEIDEEISVGDYVLTNGCLAAIVLVDAVSRFVPGVIGHDHSAMEDSFEDGILDWPHYTRPRSYNGAVVPQVLLDGSHRDIDEWRLAVALEKTKSRRPDLFLQHCLKQEECLEEIKSGRMETQGVSQITLGVKKLDDAVKFYRKKVAFSLLTQTETKATFAVGKQQLCLVVEKSQRLETETNLFELETFSQPSFKALLRRLKEKATVLFDCEGAVSTIAFSDPDGHQWAVHLRENNDDLS